VRLLGIDPNGLAQRVQDKMIKLLVINRTDRAQNTKTAAPTQPLPPTRHKVSVRSLPLPQSAHRAGMDQSSAQAHLATLGQPDPVAVRAIAQFTEGQARPAPTDAPDGIAGTAVTVPDTPAVVSAAQLAGTVSSRRPIGVLTVDSIDRMKGAVLGKLAAYDATIRTAAVLLIASGIALVIALM